MAMTASDRFRMKAKMEPVARPAIKNVYRVSHPLLENGGGYVCARTPEEARRFFGLRDDSGAVQISYSDVGVVGVDPAHDELPPLPISVLPGVPPTPSFDPLHDAAKFAPLCAETNCECAPTCTVCGKGKCYDRAVYPGWHSWVCDHCGQRSGFSRWKSAEGKEVT